MSRLKLTLAAMVIAVAGLFAPTTARAEDDRIDDIIRVLQKHADKMDATNRRLDSLEQRQAAMARPSVIIVENQTPETQTITINNQSFRIPAYGVRKLGTKGGTFRFRWETPTAPGGRFTLYENEEQRLILTDEEDD